MTPYPKTPVYNIPLGDGGSFVSNTKRGFKVEKIKRLKALVKKVNGIKKVVANIKTNSYAFGHGWIWASIDGYKFVAAYVCTDNVSAYTDALEKKYPEGTYWFNPD